jgi:hypothetical protein
MTSNLLRYVQEAKENFDRTIDCKHTPFDDLYPYMLEDPNFFWYKRHAAWANLLTTIHIAENEGADWRSLFKPLQQAMITNKVLNRKVLDFWLEQPSEVTE